MNMNSTGLQHNFNLCLGSATKEDHKTPNRRLCCEKCRFSTKDIKLFERHISHHEEVTFSCNFCNHVSYSRVESQRHVVKHKGSFPYKCSWCPYGAVRRDYMVKHIQRIHGKTADGSFTTDCSLSSTNLDRLSQTEAKDLCVNTTRTLGGPGHDVEVVRSSAGNVSHLLTDVIKSRPDVLHLVGKTVQPTRSQISSSRAQTATSTPCGLTVTKTLPCIVPNTARTVTKITQGINKPPNLLGKETAEHIKRVPEKPRLESTATNALPRICVGISGERTTQQKPLFQSTLGETSEKTANHSKPLPKIQVKLPVGNDDHLKKILCNPLEASEAQAPAISGVLRNTPLSHVVQRAAASGANSTTPHTTHGIQMAEKPVLRRTRPNILLNPLLRKLQSSGKPSVQVEVPTSLNQSVQHNKPLVVSSPKESHQNSANVQVELLAPLNQPIQHNKPLTVSCPEEITIPAGCLVELVEVKNVNGSRELELRLVPQQLARPQLVAAKVTNAISTPTDRVSLKCRVATDDNQSRNINHRISSSNTNNFSESLVNGSDLRKLSTNIKVTVKNEPEMNVHCVSKNVMQVHGSSSKSLPGALRPLVCKPPESNKASQQMVNKEVLNDTTLVKQIQQLQFTGTSLKATNENITSKSHRYELKPAQASLNKCKDSESSYQGLPVISSVFSLCPIPQGSLNHTQIRDRSIEMQDGKARITADLLQRERIKNTTLGVCKPNLKSGAEISVVTKNIINCGKLNKGNGESVEDIKPSKGTVPQKKTYNDYQTFLHDKNTITSERCSSSPDAPQPLPSSSVIISSSQHGDDSTKRKDEPLQFGNILNKQKDEPQKLSMNPTVALVRMPSLEFFSLSECTKSIPEKVDSEESITARPVLCCASNQQNLQERSIKLVLKRKRTESDFKHFIQDPKLGLTYIDSPPVYKRVRKHKKRTKKCKFLKVRGIVGKYKKGKVCFMPLRHDQRVKLPGPNQPVVVLNHPRPLLKVIRVKGPTFNQQEHLHSTSEHHQTVGSIPSLKMKLKRVQGRNYEVTELILKGVSEKTV